MRIVITVKTFLNLELERHNLNIGHSLVVLSHRQLYNQRQEDENNIQDTQAHHHQFVTFADK